jgi:hypothetical protein
MLAVLLGATSVQPFVVCFFIRQNDFHFLLSIRKKAIIRTATPIVRKQNAQLTRIKKPVKTLVLTGLDRGAVTLLWLNRLG